MTRAHSEVVQFRARICALVRQFARVFYSLVRLSGLSGIFDGIQAN